MSEEWMDRTAINFIENRLRKKKFADRVQVIQKLLTIINETLDGMEAEVAREVP